MKKGLTLLEVLVSLVLLTIFIFGGMSLYASSVQQTRRSRFLLTELWLAKGKLDTAAETQKPLVQSTGKFTSPFQDYAFRFTQSPVPKDPSLQLLEVAVSGPEHTTVKLERIAPTTSGIAHIWP